MRKFNVLMFMFASLIVSASNPIKGVVPNGNQMEADYKYQIVVGSQDTSAVVMCNGQINNIQNSSTRRGWSDLGESIASAYKSTFTQKTLNASSSLLGLGVNYITTLAQKSSKDFESWSKAKQQQCTYKKDLSSEETIDDFYYRSSVNGALDPRDLKFNGFVCRNFIEPRRRKSEKSKMENNSRKGLDVFYVSCKLRTDSLGIAHLTNHSKFLLEVDSLVFNPKYCNIPNNKPKQVSEGFDYRAYTDLELEIKVKVFSSWINDITMITSDYQLGEFVIRAEIDKNALDSVGNETLFVYNKNNPKTKDLVCVIGESFIVPRSFVGTVNEPVWGTGQYKLAIEVSQSCQLNAKYYIKKENNENEDVVNFSNLPEYKEWDKAVWKEEWKQMKGRGKSNSFLSNAWTEIRTAYIGSNWVKELVDPIGTQILLYETKELNGLFNLSSSVQTTTGAPATKDSKATPAPTEKQPSEMPKL